jgi:hypothetical protein
MNHQYVGDELNAFQYAKNWKSYWVDTLFLFIPKELRTIEIGSGLGGNAKAISMYTSNYAGFEPDESLVTIAKGKNPDLEFNCGDISSLHFLAEPRVLIYADVLEHIEDDLQELLIASKLLASNSYIGILVPAHQHLFSNFDKKIGHFRRYSLDSLYAVVPPGFSVKFAKELDPIGYFLARLSKKFLDKGEISILQVRFWDRLIPLTKLLDSLGLFPGKSILMVVKKD